MTIITLASCSSPKEQTKLPQSTPLQKTHVEEVTRGSITNVLSIEGTVQSETHFTIHSPHDGTVLTSGGKLYLANGKKKTHIKLPPKAHLTALLVPHKTVVKKNQPIAVGTHRGFSVTSEIPPESMYRLYGNPGKITAKIDKGPGPFECQLLGNITPVDESSIDVQQSKPTNTDDDPTPQSQNNNTPTEKPTHPASTASKIPVAAMPEVSHGTPSKIRCIPPENLEFYVGSKAIIGITTGSAQNVLKLPIEAVSGLSQTGEVTLQSGEKRQVKLGISDGIDVEIVAGLNENDKVLSH